MITFFHMVAVFNFVNQLSSEDLFNLVDKPTNVYISPVISFKK